MKRWLALVLVAVLLIPMAVYAKEVVIRDESTGKEMIYNTETGRVYPKDAPKENGGGAPNGPLPDEKGIPGLNYSKEPGEDPLAWRAITGPGYIIEGRNRDLGNAASVKVVPLPGNNYKNDIYLVDADGNRVHADATLRVYMKLPGNVARPIVVRVEGKETHFAEVEGLDYVSFAYDF